LASILIRKGGASTNGSEKKNAERPQRANIWDFRREKKTLNGGLMVRRRNTENRKRKILLPRGNEETAIDGRQGKAVSWGDIQQERVSLETRNKKGKLDTWGVTVGIVTFSNVPYVMAVLIPKKKGSPGRIRGLHWERRVIGK